MRILIADPISFVGHLDYNFGLYRALSISNECSLITNKYTKAELEKKGVPSDAFLATYSDEISMKSFAQKYRYKLAYHLKFRQELLKVYKLINSYAEAYDVVLLTSIEVYSFFFFSGRLKKPYIVMDHAIGDVDSKRFYRLMWKLISSRVGLIVFEDYIKKMVNARLPKRKVSVLKHPLSKWNVNDSNSKDYQDEILIFCPSASNDPSFIEQLENEKIPDGLKIVVKISKESNVNKNGLKEYSNRITEEEYINYYVKSEFILIPYRSNYNYRYSGVLLEAIQLNKKVLVLDNNTLRNYETIFPNNVYLFSTLEEMYSIVKEKQGIPTSECDLSEYEDDAINERFLRIISG